MEETRKLAASIMAASIDEVALPSSTCAGLASFLGGLDLNGRSIVLGHPCFAGISQVCAAHARSGARIIEVSLAKLCAAIDRVRPVAVVLPQVAQDTGRLIDVNPVIRTAASVGAATVVDCSHSLGHVPSPDADVLLACGYKFLFGIPGVAVMRVRQEWCSRSVPRSTGWFAARNVLSMGRGYEPSEGARRFESGTPSFPSVFALRETLGALAAAGPAVARHREQVRSALAPLRREETADDFAFVVLTSRVSSPLNALSGIGCAASGTGLGARLAPSIANKVEEVDRIVDHLRRGFPDIGILNEARS